MINQAQIANLAKRSALRTSQTAIGNCGACSATAMPQFLSGLNTSAISDLAERGARLKKPGLYTLGCDCDRTGVPHCDSCKNKMGLGAWSTTSYILGLLVLVAIAGGVAWKMGVFKRPVAARKNRRKR